MATIKQELDTLKKTNGLAKPTVHMNGTSKQVLMDQLCNAIDAIHVAGNTLAAAYPNGRDYYPQGADAIHLAMNQHAARMAKLREVAEELREIVESL